MSLNTTIGFICLALAMLGAAHLFTSHRIGLLEEKVRMLATEDSR